MKYTVQNRKTCDSEQKAKILADSIGFETLESY